MIAGPTASGKSDLASKLAAGHDAIIVNADSMQVYSNLQLITARPSLQDEQRIPHRLFGHISPHEDYSVARWLEEAEYEIKQGLNAEKQVFVVGGTGLYFSALTKGLSPIPNIDSNIRDKWRQALNNPDVNLFHELERVDPAIAAGLKPNDHQRICRALEVIESTGKSLLMWQQEKTKSPIAEISSAKKLVMMPDRKLLHARINERFDRMVQMGAIEEVDEFLALLVDPKKTAMKAIGVPQIASYLSGEVTLDDAVEQAKAASRQYAKRQFTWFRNQFDDDWEVLT